MIAEEDQKSGELSSVRSRVVPTEEGNADLSPSRNVKGKILCGLARAHWLPQSQVATDEEERGKKKKELARKAMGLCAARQTREAAQCEPKRGVCSRRIEL